MRLSKNSALLQMLNAVTRNPSNERRSIRSKWFQTSLSMEHPLHPYGSWTYPTTRSSCDQRLHTDTNNDMGADSVAMATVTVTISDRDEIGKMKIQNWTVNTFLPRFEAANETDFHWYRPTKSRIKNQKSNIGIGNTDFRTRTDLPKSN